MSENMPALPSDNRIGQATHVEQSRAVAEVQGKIIVARQCPRDEEQARREMLGACSSYELAEKAFYRYSRGGTQVSGPSVILAREIATIWQNMDYDVAELRRDDQYGQSEMKAWAWDKERNVSTSNTFIVPHKRDKRGGPERITDMRDIYENNANNGARRMRECIFALLPTWYVEAAKKACRERLKLGEDSQSSVDQQIDKAVDWLGNKGVKLRQIETKLDKSRKQWDENDLAELSVIMRSLHNGEVKIEDEFPHQHVTGAELGAGQDGGES